RRLAEPRLRHQQALKLRQDLHEASSEAQSWAALAGLALAEDKPAEAERWARQAAERFHAEDERRNEAGALELLAQSLLAQRHPSEAAEALQKGERLLLARGAGGLERRLGIPRCRLQAAAGQPQPALAQLAALAEQAARQGQLGSSLEARLAALQIDAAPPRAARAAELQR